MKAYKPPLSAVTACPTLTKRRSAIHRGAALVYAGCRDSKLSNKSISETQCYTPSHRSSGGSVEAYLQKVVDDSQKDGNISLSSFI
jgi:hypothetical protein